MPTLLFWVMNIDKIIQAIQANIVLVSRHAREEAEEDSLSIDEICFSVSQGEIIEDYLDDRPYPSCLIYGTNRPLQKLNFSAGRVRVSNSLGEDRNDSY